MNENIFISIKAEQIVEDLLTKAENRNPDNFDLYIYNGMAFRVCFADVIVLTPYGRFLCIRSP